MQPPPRGDRCRAFVRAGSRVQDVGSLTSGLQALAQPFKLRLCRGAHESQLRDYSSNVVLIEPLATISAVEDFLWMRVYRSPSSTAAGGADRGLSPGAAAAEAAPGAAARSAAAGRGSQVCHWPYHKDSSCIAAQIDYVTKLTKPGFGMPSRQPDFRD